MNLDLFDTMVRHPDHETSREAAQAVLPVAETLRDVLWQTIAVREPITAPELEELPEFAAYSPSTVRKRVSELLADNRIYVHDRRTVTLNSGRLARAMSYKVRSHA